MSVLTPGLPAIKRVEARLEGSVRFAFRHFPLTEIHPHALAASRAAEAAARQGRFWEMHDLLFHRQRALETTTCAATPASWGSIPRVSTRTASASRCSSASRATFAAESPQARFSAPPRCSSTARCTSAGTTPTRCWRSSPVSHVPDAARRRPAIVVVDDEPAVLAAVARDLRRGFGERYRIVRRQLGRGSARGPAASSSRAASRWRCWSPTSGCPGCRAPIPGAGAGARARRPSACCSPPTPTPRRRSRRSTRSTLDYYLLKPWDPPEEQLFPVVEDLLDDVGGRRGARVRRRAGDRPPLLARIARPARLPCAQPRPGALARRRARRRGAAAAEGGGRRRRAPARGAARGRHRARAPDRARARRAARRRRPAGRRALRPGDRRRRPRRAWPRRSTAPPRA